MLVGDDTLPPGTSEPPALQTLRWLIRPIAFLEEMRRRHGDAFSVQLLGMQTPLVLVSSPDVIKALYSERHLLPPGRQLSLKPIVGARSVLLLEGAEHLTRRKLMLPPFHGDRMRAYEPIMREAAAREIERWPTDRPFPAHPSMQAITLEVILRAVFGVADSGRGARLRTLLADLLGSTASPALQFAVLLSRRFGGPDPLARIEALTGEIDALLLAEIAERRADELHTAERDDICSLLISARFEDGEPMDDREVRDQLLTLLVAGHETTATALAWTLDLLTHYPETLDRLRAEVDAGGDTYLRAVVSESLRLRPVVPLAGRRLVSELRVDGLTLPPGTDVSPAIWLTHTDPDVYPDPYAFRPERFLDGGPPSYAWIPFGGGIRRCLGAAFAEMEMRLVLSEILRRRLPRAATKRPESVTRRNVTFSPRGGTRILAAPRP
jgi:cytochrome P450 family 135